jgi:hypothetical protein
VLLQGIPSAARLACYQAKAVISRGPFDMHGSDEERKPRCGHPAPLLSALLR